MAQNTLVKEVITKAIYTLTPHEFLVKAKELFDQHSFHHLPVVDEQNGVCGMISTSDLQRLEVGATLFRHKSKDKYTEAYFTITPVESVMQENVVCLQSDATIEEAYKIFKQNTFHALPVMEDEVLVGILTPLDLLRYFFDLQE